MKTFFQIILAYATLLGVVVTGFCFVAGFVLFLGSVDMVFRFLTGERPFFFEPIVLCVIFVLATTVMYEITKRLFKNVKMHWAP